MRIKAAPPQSLMRLALVVVVGFAKPLSLECKGRLRIGRRSRRFLSKDRDCRDSRLVLKHMDFLEILHVRDTRDAGIQRALLKKPGFHS